MTEAAYIRKLGAALTKQFGPTIFFFKTHGGPYQRAGLPDIIGFLRGRPFFIEVKNETKLTALQAAVIQQLQLAGVSGRIVYTDESVEEVIHWLYPFAF